VSSASEPPLRRVYRLPAFAYLAVLFLVVCAAPVALAGSGAKLSSVVVGWRLVFFVIPVLAAVFIARTATIVDRDGLRVRLAFGSHRIAWDDVRGLSVSGRAIYATLADGSMRLPCVQLADLTDLARSSGGRLPELREPTRKYAPARRPRRRPVRRG